MDKGNRGVRKGIKKYKIIYLITEFSNYLQLYWKVTGLLACNLLLIGVAVFAIKNLK